MFVLCDNSYRFHIGVIVKLVVVLAVLIILFIVLIVVEVLVTIAPARQKKIEEQIKERQNCKTSKKYHVITKG